MWSSALYHGWTEPANVAAAWGPFVWNTHTHTHTHTHREKEREICVHYTKSVRALEGCVHTHTHTHTHTHRQ